MDISVSPSTSSLTTTGRAWSFVIVLTMRMLVHSYGPFTPIWDNGSVLFSLKTMESLQIGVTTHFWATPLFSMRTVLLASLQSYRSVDADAWCKRALGQVFTRENILQAWWNTLKKSIHCVYHCMDHKRKYQYVRLHGNHCYPVFALNA